MIRFALVVGTVVAVARWANAAEAVEVRFAKPQPGDRVRVSVESEQTATQTTRVFGQESDTTVKKVFRATYIDEFVAPLDAEGKREKLVRTYEKYEATLDGKPQPAPPLGAAIVIEKADGKYRYLLDGKPLAVEVVAVLESEFGRRQGMRGDNIAPARAVKPGDSWNLDPTAVFKGYGGEGKVPLLLDKGTMSGKLLKAATRDGRLFGTVELSAQLPVKDVGGDSGYKLKPGTALQYTETIETALDGTASAEKRVSAVSSRIQLDSDQATVIYAVATRTAVATDPLPPKK